MGRVKCPSYAKQNLGIEIGLWLWVGEIGVFDSPNLWALLLLHIRFYFFCSGSATAFLVTLPVHGQMHAQLNHVFQTLLILGSRNISMFDQNRHKSKGYPHTKITDAVHISHPQYQIYIIKQKCQPPIFTQRGVGGSPTHHSKAPYL